MSVHYIDIISVGVRLVPRVAKLAVLYTMGSCSASSICMRTAASLCI